LEYNQLAPEIQWLRGELPGSFLQNPPQAWIKIIERVEHLLSHPKLAGFLGLLEKHNRDHPRAACGRSSVPFLLGPLLFNVIHSVEAQQEYLAQMPAMAGPPAQVRAHLQEISARSKSLAGLLRQGPQPAVMLTVPTILLPLFPSLQSQSELTGAVTLDRLLIEAATALAAEARRIGRAKQHRPLKNKTNAKMERTLAVRALLRTLKKEKLDEPYFGWVAIIAEILSKIGTDVDYVKKTAQRQCRSVTGDSLPRNS
jgi:hypothetical protein